MRVCHVSETPIAGAAWCWSEAFKEAGYDSFAVAGARYSDGRAMPCDASWPPSPGDIKAIQDADLIFCYQGYPYRHKWFPRDKPTVGLYVSQPHHIHKALEQDGWPWAVIAEYQPRLYPGCAVVPNLVPLKHPWFQPGEKPQDHIRIAYSPSNKILTGWDSKGYGETSEALYAVQAEDVDIDIIMGVPLEECLRRKSTAHIVIDECVTGSYHGNSIQGLALGCVMINGCDFMTEQRLHQVTGGCGSPFVVCTVSDLVGVLQHLIVWGPKRLAELGRQSREWIEGALDPAECINRSFVPLMDAAFEHAKEGA